MGAQQPQKPRSALILIVAAVLALGVIVQLTRGDQAGAKQLLKQIALLLSAGAPASSETGLVKRVVDGDTIVVEIDGQEYRVRYIGVDAPESTTRQECYGREAARYNRTLVEGQAVRLERDVSETDRFGRLLRYVYLTNGEMVNEVLIREGFALARTFPPDVKYQERLKEAEREAKQKRRGLWRSCPNPGSVIWLPRWG
ncbi:MAG: thermonuclease family protein [Anaerolineae bacterium]|nr:thermonuclease family protein [Anaerolineae bacterium]